MLDEECRKNVASLRDWPTSTTLFLILLYRYICKLELYQPQWKISLINSLHKNGNKDDLQNYSKISERIV